MSMVSAEVIDGVLVVTINNSNSSELWRLKPVYIPEYLEYEDDKKLVKWAKKKWPDVKLLIQLTQEDDRTGVLPFDFEGCLLTEEGGERDEG